jgi:hypothetical protein
LILTLTLEGLRISGTILVSLEGKQRVGTVVSNLSS